MTDRDLFFLKRFFTNRRVIEDCSLNSRLILSETKEEVLYLRSVFSYDEPSNYAVPIAKGIVRHQKFASRRDVSSGIYIRYDNFIVDSCKPNDVKAIIFAVDSPHTVAIYPERFFGEFSYVKRSIETYSGRGIREGVAFLPSASNFHKMKHLSGVPAETVLQKDFGISLFSYEIAPGKTCNKYWASDDEYSGSWMIKSISLLSLPIKVTRISFGKRFVGNKERLV